MVQANKNSHLRDSKLERTSFKKKIPFLWAVVKMLNEMTGVNTAKKFLLQVVNIEIKGVEQGVGRGFCRNEGLEMDESPSRQ